MRKREYHGGCGMPEYQIWKTMIRRCHASTSQRFSLYGGRGIVVCDQWRNSFAAFVRDMGIRPSPKHTIDRLNNDLGYGPENCAWRLQAEQAANKRNNRKITFGDETLHLSEWARRYDIHYRVLGRRLDRGWSIEESLTTPTMNTGRKRI
jgi:hypothetical protein